MGPLCSEHAHRVEMQRSRLVWVRRARPRFLQHASSAFEREESARLRTRDAIDDTKHWLLAQIADLAWSEGRVGGLRRDVIVGICGRSCALDVCVLRAAISRDELGASLLGFDLR